MSVSSPIIDEEITFLTSEPPFEPKPLIADIIRTRYCIPGSIFLVEAVDVFQAASTTSSGKRKRRIWRGIRLLLGDGELCVQALLAGEMHSYVDRGDVAVGSYVRLESFELEGTGSGSVKGKEKETMDGGEASGIVYLTVENLVAVGWNNRLLAMLDAERGTSPPQPDPADDSAPDESDVELDQKADINHADQEVEEGINVATEDLEEEEIQPVDEYVMQKPQDPETDFLEEVADADDDFEVMQVSPQKTQQKRAEVSEQIKSASSDYSVPVDPEHLPWSCVDPTKPLKLTPLRSIPHLPYKQNWSTNILAVIASISDLQPSNLPPFSQRVARLAHPSTPKLVHLTVFLDAPNFAPEVGSVVLLLGVKNHRFDGGSLKKYASDKPKHGGRWWFENPFELTWCDVRGLGTWWYQSQHQ